MRNLCTTAMLAACLAGCASTSGQSDSVDVIGGAVLSVAAQRVALAYVQSNPDKAEELGKAAAQVAEALESDELVTLAAARARAREAIGYDELLPAEQAALTTLADTIERAAQVAVDSQSPIPDSTKVEIARAAGAVAAVVAQYQASE